MRPVMSVLLRTATEVSSFYSYLKDEVVCRDDRIY